jgi:type II secretory pathway pseudopilin PulG
MRASTHRLAASRSARARSFRTLPGGSPAAVFPHRPAIVFQFRPISACDRVTRLRTGVCTISSIVQPPIQRSRESGLTLVEVVVATALFAAVSVSAAHLLVWAVRTMWSTGAETIAVAAAQEKLEQLESLAWRFDAAGNRMSDTDTDLTGSGLAGGGPGLAASPPNALRENLIGHVDYLDDQGQWLGTGAEPPPGAVFVRRWAVRPLPDAPEDTLILQVLVAPIANSRVTDRTPAGRPPGGSLLATARTRVR